ncbi:MAG: CehA/McbA family metallohydrolase [Micromonosporaceae bacterium]
MTHVHRGTWQPEDRAEAMHRYLPVDVPPGAAGLRVELAYDRGAGVLDLGVFDPDGRFRGYSGGARNSFALSANWATPGYLPGELPPGEWQVFLRLHRVASAGVPYEVRANVGPVAPDAAPDAPPVPGRPERRDLPTVDGLAWFAGDLHAHTVHSDGSLTIEELATRAVTTGLDFLAITDHNTVSHHAHLDAVGRRYGLTLIPGQEVTSDRGHANAFGAIGWVDFRRPAADWVSTVAERGGLLSVNHPLAADYAWRQPLPVKPPLAEVWHSGWWDRTWGAPLAWLLAWAPGTVPVGGSDFHHPAESVRVGHPTTWVAAASPGVDDVLAALAAGRTAVSESPDGPLLLRVGDELVALDADGLLLTDFTGRRRAVRGDRHAFPAAPGAHWLEDERTRIMALSA